MQNNHAVKCRQCGGQGYKYTEDSVMYFKCHECPLHERMRIFSMKHWEQRHVKLKLRNL